MLQLPKPSSFDTPKCIGFFNDWERAVHAKLQKRERRFGWIFEMPDAADTEKPLVSLFDVLNDNECTRPSLNMRVSLAAELASTVLYMHTVNWLHKAIRSSNVAFQSIAKEVNYTKPILSGYEYSRPDSKDHTTEAGPAKPIIDMYRWPSIQGDVPRDGANSSRKTYDIYAFGLLLLEIAYWQPLHQVLEMKDYPGISFQPARDVRATLLETSPRILSGLKERVGDKYYEAVKRCIIAHGNEAFGVKESDDQEGGTIGLKLQEAFVQYVVDVLKMIKL